MISHRQITEAAILGFEAQKKELEATIRRLRAELHRAPATGTRKRSVRARAVRHLSAAGRRATVEANRRRWAVARTGKAGPELVKPKQKPSAAQLRAMRANAIKARAARRAA